MRLSSCAGDIAVAIFVPFHKGRATVRDTWRYLNLSRGHQPFDIFRYFPDISSPNQAIRWRSLFGFYTRLRPSPTIALTLIVPNAYTSCPISFLICRFK